MLDKITAALGAIDTGGTFATELTCSADALHLQVDGVGLLRFPISAAAAKELCAVARPAPFGKRDRTLHDRRVRDSWEIGAEQTRGRPRSARSLPSSRSVLASPRTARSKPASTSC
jgi:hypothetical protein